MLFADHEGALVGHVPIVVLDSTSFVALHAGEGVEVEDGRLALPLAQGVFGGSGDVDGQMVPGFPGVLRANVALVVQVVVLDADAGHRDGGDVVHWLLHHFAQPVQCGLY